MLVSALTGCATSHPAQFLDSLGADNLTNEMISTLDGQLLAEGPFMPQELKSTLVADQTSFQPLLKVLERKTYPVANIIVVGKPSTIQRAIRAPSLKRIVCIYGEKDSASGRLPENITAQKGHLIEVIPILLHNKTTPRLQGKYGEYGTYVPTWGKPSTTGDNQTDSFLSEIYRAAIRGASSEEILRIAAERESYKTNGRRY